MFYYKSCNIFFGFLFFSLVYCSPDTSETNSKEVPVVAQIVGKVFPPDNAIPNWQAETQILLRGGIQKAFLKEDGTFTFNNIQPGSYVVEVVSPTLTYEPIRVEINSKGKIRARKVNHIQTSQVIQVAYPLKIRSLGLTRYFQVREQWRVTDFLFNPMVVMMVLPLLLVMILPKMMNDPEARKEMEQISNLTKYDIPEMSEVITSYFGGGKIKPKSIKQNKKGNKNN